MEEPRGSIECSNENSKPNNSNSFWKSTKASLSNFVTFKALKGLFLTFTALGLPQAPKSRFSSSLLLSVHTHTYTLSHTHPHFYIPFGHPSIACIQKNRHAALRQRPFTTKNRKPRFWTPPSPVELHT